MLNRTTEVDLSNYVENGEWYLVSIKIHRNVVRTCYLRDLFHPITCLKYITYVKILASGNSSLKSFSHSVGVLCLLSRAISGCDIYSEYQTSHPLLPLQCHIPVYNDVGPHAASLLSAAWLRGEDHHGHHCASCLQVTFLTLITSHYFYKKMDHLLKD